MAELPDSAYLGDTDTQRGSRSPAWLGDCRVVGISGIFPVVGVAPDRPFFASQLESGASGRTALRAVKA
jgi:hypothetical protein